MFSNGFHSQAICQPFRKICICLNGFSYLFIVNISLIEQLGHPFVENISPFKQLGHHLLKNISLFEGLGLFSIIRLVSSVWKVQDWIVLHYLSHRSVLCKCHKSMLYQNQKWNHAWNNYVYHIKFTVKRNDKGNNLATCKAARKKLQLCFCVIKWQ